MAISSINYTNPASGTKIETVSFTRGLDTKHHQAYVYGWQPFVVADAHWINNYRAETQVLRPCHKINWTGSSVWVASGSGTSEYYYNDGDDFSFYLKTMQVLQVIANGNDLAQGDIGSLAAGEWGIGDNDSLGYDTIYVRLTDGADPDSKADAYLCAAFAYPCAGASEAMILPVFSETGVTAKVRPILYPADVRKEAGDTDRYTVPIILAEIDIASVDVELGDSAFKQFGTSFTFSLKGAAHYAIAVTTPPASGTLEMYGGVI